MISHRQKEDYKQEQIRKCVAAMCDRMKRLSRIYGIPEGKIANVFSMGLMVRGLCDMPLDKLRDCTRALDETDPEPRDAQTKS